MMTPPDSPPSWYSDFKVPTNLLPTFQPLIYLVGLDNQNNPTHRSFWEVLTIKNTGRDFQPKYFNVPLEHKFREKKNKIPEGLDYYIPRGILKSNWVQKHTEEIPSVVVAFFDMNWSDQQWNERKQELTKQIKNLKTSLAPCGTQILVTLMKPAGIVEDNFTPDRASALCAATEISPKCLFVLAHSNLERMQACVQRLEIGMREISKAYYLAKIKSVKGWKDKVTVTPLLVRYNFKIGVLQEIRKDFIASISHYQSAFEALLTIKPTDPNIQELKMVAAVLTYRLCKIYLNKADGKEAKAHFEKHIRSFLKMEGNKALQFEHFSWLSQQYHQFGDLLKQYYRGNAHNIPDPVPYFISAGKYMEKRREVFSKTVTLFGKPVWPAEMNPYNGSTPVKLYCIGQRPWWSNPFSQDYLYATEDVNTITALTYFESLCKHSDSIIDAWGIASEICRESQRIRCRCQLMSMMGAEFLRAKEYAKCIILMTHILREFGQEDWKNIVFEASSCGFRAAFSSGNIPAYCNFLLILLKGDISDLVSKEKQRFLWSNLDSVLNGRIPAPIDDKMEFNENAWQKALSEPDWTSYVEIHSNSILECKSFFVQDAISVKETATIRFVLTNVSEFKITMRKYGVRTSPADYSAESNEEISFLPQETRQVELILKPLIRDISKHIQLQVAYVDIGKPNRSVLLHYSPVKASNPYLWSTQIGKSYQGGSSVRIEQSKSEISVCTLGLETALVNEWYKIVIAVANKDSRKYERISVACQLQTSEPENVAISADPITDFPSSHTFVKELSKLEANEVCNVIVFFKAIVQLSSDIKLLMKIKYTDDYGQALQAEKNEELKVVSPFQISHRLKNSYNVALDSVLINEDLKLTCTIKNTSSTVLRITRVSLTTELGFVTTKHHVGKAITSNSLLRPDEETTCLFILSSSEIGNYSPGTLELSWRRVSGTVDLDNISRIPIDHITFLMDNSLYLSATFSNNGHGKVKHPMIGLYTLVNHSNAVFDLSIIMESTEVFMSAGPKKLSVKLYGREKYAFNYVLFPLVTGLVDAPKLSFFTPANGTTVLEPIGLPVHLNSPKTLFITA